MSSYPQEVYQARADLPLPVTHPSYDNGFALCAVLRTPGNDTININPLELTMVVICKDVARQMSCMHVHSFDIYSTGKSLSWISYVCREELIYTPHVVLSNRRRFRQSVPYHVREVSWNASGLPITFCFDGLIDVSLKGSSFGFVPFTPLSGSSHPRNQNQAAQYHQTISKPQTQHQVFIHKHSPQISIHEMEGSSPLPLTPSNLISNLLTSIYHLHPSTVVSHPPRILTSPHIIPQSSIVASGTLGMTRYSTCIN